MLEQLPGPSQLRLIGLTMAEYERIVELLGGRIWVVSARGEGTCFSFTLPLAAQVALQHQELMQPIVRLT